MDNCENILNEIKATEPEVKDYLIAQLHSYQKLRNFQEAIECALPRHALDRAEIIAEVIKQIVSL